MSSCSCSRRELQYIIMPNLYLFCLQ
uniref:Uncharacterized protein n=1 Tax=Anguilla anguilla TaxID=7936 RepID=A0A0E9VBM1_ANGAN